MHEPEQRHRRSSRPRDWRAPPPAARAAPLASSRPFPQPGPSPLLPSLANLLMTKTWLKLMKDHSVRRQRYEIGMSAAEHTPARTWSARTWGSFVPSVVADQPWR